MKRLLAGAVLVCLTAQAQADVVARFQPLLETHLPSAAGKRPVRFASGDGAALVALPEGSDATPALRIGYPRSYSAPFVVEHGAQRVTVRAIGAHGAAVRTDGGRLFYEDAYPGVDVLQLPSSHRSEEVLLLREKGAPLVYEYSVTDMRGVTDVVLDRGGIRFNPDETAASSNTVLGIEKPWVIDATGKKSETAARWQVVNNGTVILRLTVDDEGLEYPLLVDPSFIPVGAMVHARSGHSAALLHDGRVLIVGGWVDMDQIEQAEVFDRAAGFSETGSVTVPRTRPTMTTLQDGRVLVAGGLTGGVGAATNAAELYDPDTGTFTVTDAMVDARADHVATLLSDGRVLLVGGRDETGARLTTAEIFDPATEEFTATGSMAVARAEAAIATLPDGRVLIVGGYGTPPLASAEIYDPQQGTFTSTGSMATARYQPVAMLLANGLVLVSGGNNNGPLTSSELFNPATGTFSATGSIAIEGPAAGLMPNGKALFVGKGSGNPSGNGYGLFYNPTSGASEYPLALPYANHAYGTGTMMPGGDLLIAGSTEEQTAGSAELFSIESPAFLTAGAANAAREHHTSTLLPDGRVLIAGGRNADGTLASVEIFDPVSEDFTNAAPMSVARYGHAATLLRDGRVLVTGGGTTTTEIYDPATNSWSPSGVLSPARRFHTATLLWTGAVLVTGGTYIAGPMTRAELWVPWSGEFSLLETMSTTRSNHAAVLLPDGRVVVAGGSTSTATALVEIWDPATGEFTNGGTGTVLRIGARAALLGDGRVLIAGGNESGNASAEVFDPATGSVTPLGSAIVAAPLTFTSTVLSDGTVLLIGSNYDQAGRRYLGGSAATMAIPRENHRATLLEDGRVLVTGGTSNGTATTLAEVFSTNEGAQESRRPVISTMPTLVCQPAAINVTGINFSSMITGASGKTTGSEANLPLLRLQRVEDDVVFFARPVSRNATSFNSATLPNVPFGHYRATVISNGISSLERIVEISLGMAPIIGTYANATLVQAQDTTATPTSLNRSSFTNLTATASAGFLGSLSIDQATGTVTIDDARPAGSYTITVTASTSCASTERTFTLTVQPLAAPSVTATAASTSAINASWGPVNGATEYEVFQKAGAGPYVSLGTTAATDWTATGLTANTAYLYRVRALDHLGGLGPQSVPDLATTTTLTPIASGTPTVIQALHLNQLRTAVNAVRVAAGGAPYSFTDPSLTGVVVKAVHFQELHTVLSNARTTLSLPAYISGPSAIPEPGALVRGADITLLQQGVR